MINATERIAELMRVRGWTPYELSVQASISSNAVYDWFKKGATPSLSNISKICNAMQISLAYFFCGSDEGYTEEEKAVLEKWIALSDLEKGTLDKLIETFGIIKSHP